MYASKVLITHRRPEQPSPFVLGLPIRFQAYGLSTLEEGADGPGGRVEAGEDERSRSWCACELGSERGEEMRLRINEPETVGC